MKNCPTYLPQITSSGAEKLFGIDDTTTLNWLSAGHISSKVVTRGTKMQVNEFSRLEFQIHLFSPNAGKHQRPLETVAIDGLVLDPEFQVRVYELNQDVVDHYTNLLKLGSEPPPVFVGFIEGKKHLLGGRHRLAAAKAMGHAHLKAIVIDVCNRTEGFYVARRDNESHGLPPSKSDRKAVILAGLLRPEHAQMTVPQLAEEFKYSERQIQRIRKDLLEGKLATKRVPDERTLEERALERLVSSIDLMGKFQPELAMKLKAVIAESRGVTMSPPFGAGFIIAFTGGARNHADRD